jgi:hypothetical protein
MSRVILPYMALADARAFFDTLNHAYVAVHKAKEDLFWTTYMGTSHDDAGFAKVERAYKDFVSDPSRLEATRAHADHLAGLAAESERDALLHGLRGWQALFEAHVIENDEARRLMHEIVEAETALFAQRRAFVPTHVNAHGEVEDATLGALATNLTTNPVEAHRRTSFEALRRIEQWTLDHGFLDIVMLRNRFARALGYADFFEMKLRKNERMTTSGLFTILDDFIRHTETANARTLDELRARHGQDAVRSWNLRYFTGGDIVRRMDAYLPFAPALRRWIESFRRLGIGFRGAMLQLDLLDRPDKHQNGFCHVPVPAWVNERGEWVASHINFTSEARPDQVGSGFRAINTLFHEGGHAAHFANIVQNAPCFSQEYPPTSMAYAETQSMFCDSLLDDADWLKRYATGADGTPIPDELIRERVASRQPMRAFDTRSLAVVPYFESALYAMTDDARTPDTVLALARQTEVRVLGMESPRPLLAIPHLLNQESAASYQGYLLAEMAVSQTRAFFLNRDGYLTDNPAIGPALRTHYWEPGNSVDHDATLRSLTGEGFSARYLAKDCNLSVADAWAAARAGMAAAAARPSRSDERSTLDAHIRIVHGTEVLADSGEGEDAMCSRFEAWVREHYPAEGQGT